MLKDHTNSWSCRFAYSSSRMVPESSLASFAGCSRNSSSSSSSSSSLSSPSSSRNFASARRVSRRSLLALAFTLAIVNSQPAAAIRKLDPNRRAASLAAADAELAAGSSNSHSLSAAAPSKEQEDADSLLPSSLMLETQLHEDDAASASGDIIMSSSSSSNSSVASSETVQHEDGTGALAEEDAAVQHQQQLQHQLEAPTATATATGSKSIQPATGAERVDGVSPSGKPYRFISEGQMALLAPDAVSFINGTRQPGEPSQLGPSKILEPEREPELQFNTTCEPGQVIIKHRVMFGGTPFCSGTKDDCLEIGYEAEAYSEAGCWFGKKIICQRETCGRGDNHNPLCMPWAFRVYITGQAPFCRPDPCDCFQQSAIPYQLSKRVHNPCVDTARFYRAGGHRKKSCTTGHRQICIRPINAVASTMSDEVKQLIAEGKARCNLKEDMAHERTMAGIAMVDKIAEGVASFGIAR
eukprot:CAMPEP_0206457196 /NCGR_PEP_ID=MMETSP0324_2-20121206/22816_1 /ASSEMBLY_ACC=CAM_ASM_000836 /TAXON_ID=2866 /ORGANISM="Crypthecodinium cohnii, Strain Seligo" /LENGTH=468 /DNA_ID=CAMNT_0053928269 /DNA_START=24 /DNA_END=1430 /DNA_ORIENTATION=-